ncbi:hypothetical protein AB0436_28385 [Streptomyces sp. NPDC051322]|uniref:hypothetical protein n=1 Tax=Streptomyces sp. NPDC051322 TaxID=3154645 RepID=UPI00344F7064
MDIVVEFDRDPSAGNRLTDELYSGLPVTGPDAVGAPPPGLLGTAVARADGALLGWVTVYCPGPEPDVAIARRLLTSPERERIVAGHVAEPDGTGDEEAALTRLFRRAADEARAAGFRVLQWDDTESELDARVAAELEASVHQEIGRKWGSSALERWEPRVALPPVRTRRPVAGPGWQGLELLTDGDGAARIAAMVAGEEMYVERVGHHGVDALELGALVAEFIRQVRRVHPSVLSFQVRESSDEVLGAALRAAGLRVSHRWWQYRLAL